MYTNLKRLACLTVALLLLMIPAASAVNFPVTFNANCPVFQSPNIRSASVNIPAGTNVTLTAINGAWAQVKGGNITAYCAAAALNLRNPVHAYANCDTKLYASASTSARSMNIGVNTDLYILGWDGDFCRVTNAQRNVTAYILSSQISNTKVVTATDPRKDVIVADWFKGGSSILKKGYYGYMYDIWSGQFIRIKRMGGHNHADVEPATAEDTAKLYAACGGDFSWDSRPVILIVGNTYVACAINTEPHGDQTIANNGYNGQFCLHMVNSKTHGGNAVNGEHQKAIQTAFRWAHSA